MDRKTILAVVIAIVIVVAAATVLLVKDSPEEDIPPVEKGPYRLSDITLPLDVRLVVCGNADNNDVIDENDLRIVQDILDNKTSWDKEANPLADAYPDGKIDQTDADLLKNMINKKDCYVYYVDYQGETVRVSYPITGTVGTTYYQQAQIAVLFDIWDDRVTACGNGSLSEISNPEWEDRFSYGKGFDVDPETVAKSGVDTVICYTQTDTTAPGIKDLVENSGMDLNVLCVNHEQLLRCVTTYGYLLDKEDISKKYLETADECQDSLQNSLKDVPTEDQPSVAIVMLYGTATTDKIRVLGYSETGNKHNLAVLINSIPNVNWIRADKDNGAYGTYVTSEWFLQNDPDYIILVGSSMGANDSMSLDEVKDLYRQKCEEVFGKTRAFQNGNIVCTSNGILNGYSNPLVSLKLLSNVYDQVDTDLADRAYDEWYSEYTKYTVEDKPTEAIFKVGA